VRQAKPVVHPGAKEHYVRAESYEARYAARSEDVDYYRGLVRPGDTVLEYGAGAGRLTLKLAQKGVQVCAVDISRPMLDLLRRRAQSLASDARRRITIAPGDMRSFRTRRRFDWVMVAFHGVGHLYTVKDMEAFLGRAWLHLEPGGKLVFDLPYPRIDMNEYDPVAAVRVTEMDGPDGPELLTLRCYQPQEIAMHLHYAGFDQVRLTSDFEKKPIDSETSVFVVTARKPHAHSP
jgi:SAM-dependent methyltransferase